MKFKIFILALVAGTVSAATLAEQYAMNMRAAARAGNATYVKLVLDTNLVPVDSADVNGFTSLHWASYFGRPSVVKLLLDYNADVTLRTKTNATALIVGASNGSLEVCQMLVDANSDVNAQDKDGYSALIIAAGKGNLAVVELLLNNSADVTLKTKTGQTAFLLAAMGNYVDVQKALVAAGANVNDQDSTGNTALILASKAGHTETVEYLLSQNADVHLRSNTNDTALMWAAFGNHLEIAKMLIGAGIDVNAGDHQGWTALMGASAQGHVEMVKLLLGHNANPSQQNILGHTALTLSSAVGNEDVSDILSSSDVALINQRDNKGMTPFVQAAANNQTYAFRVLAYKCPNISISDNIGKTAMDYAALLGNQYMINLLTVMANPTCYRFNMEYQHNDTIYQNCERLICHCTGVWKSTGIMDEECGKSEIQILTMQRAAREIAIEQASRITS